MSSLSLNANQDLGFYPPPPSHLCSSCALELMLTPYCLSSKFRFLPLVSSLRRTSSSLPCYSSCPITHWCVSVAQWGGGEGTRVGILLCLTSHLCFQDCSAMHPWTSLAPAGPRALQGSWWFDPALPISMVSATTLQVRGFTKGKPSIGRWDKVGRAWDLLEMGK